LHQRDNRKLLATLSRIRDLGNTVIVVEHDEETIRRADYVIDLGPGAGEHGGYVIFQGTPEQLIESARQQPQALSAGTRASDSLEPGAPGVGPRRLEESWAPPRA